MHALFPLLQSRECLDEDHLNVLFSLPVTWNLNLFTSLSPTETAEESVNEGVRGTERKDKEPERRNKEKDRRGETHEMSGITT